MGLVDLGLHTGLSASFLSQLETGRVVPTLRNLARIAMVFSKDLSYFFAPEPVPLFRLHHSKDRSLLPQTGVADPTYMFKSLGYLVPDRLIDPYLAEFLPNKPSVDGSTHQHPGYEFLFLLSGALEVKHNGELHGIVAGDSVYFDSSVCHNYRCTSTSEATAIIVTFQRRLASNRPSNEGSMEEPAARQKALQKDKRHETDKYNVRIYRSETLMSAAHTQRKHRI
jgi:transcriptional regulator with XRE-family HTH domain